MKLSKLKLQIKLWERNSLTTQTHKKPKLLKAVPDKPAYIDIIFFSPSHHIGFALLAPNGTDEGKPDFLH